MSDSLGQVLSFVGVGSPVSMGAETAAVPPEIEETRPEGGLPVSVIHDVLTSHNLKIEDMSSCEMKMGKVDTHDVDGKKYAKIPVSYDIVVRNQKVHIESFIFTNAEVPLGGTPEQVSDFYNKMAATSFFANQQLRALFPKTGQQTGAVDKEMAEIALKTPTFHFTLEKSAINAAHGLKEHRVFELDVEHPSVQGSSGQVASASKLQVLLTGEDKLLQKLAQAATSTTKKIPCEALETYAATPKGVEEFARDGVTELPKEIERKPLARTTEEEQKLPSFTSQGRIDPQDLRGETPVIAQPMPTPAPLPLVREKLSKAPEAAQLSTAAKKSPLARETAVPAKPVIAPQVPPRKGLALASAIKEPDSAKAKSSLPELVQFLGDEVRYAELRMSEAGKIENSAEKKKALAAAKKELLNAYEEVKAVLGYVNEEARNEINEKMPAALDEFSKVLLSEEVSSKSIAEATAALESHAKMIDKIVAKPPEPLKEAPPPPPSTPAPPFPGTSAAPSEPPQQSFEESIETSLKNASKEELTQLTERVDRELDIEEDAARKQRLEELLLDIGEKRIALESSAGTAKAFRSAMGFYKKIDELHEHYEEKLATYNKALQALDLDKLGKADFVPDKAKQKEYADILAHYRKALDDAQSAASALHAGMKKAQNALSAFADIEGVPKVYKERVRKQADALGKELLVVAKVLEELLVVAKRLEDLQSVFVAGPSDKEGGSVEGPSVQAEGESSTPAPPPPPSTPAAPRTMGPSLLEEVRGFAQNKLRVTGFRAAGSAKKKEKEETEEKEEKEEKEETELQKRVSEALKRPIKEVKGDYTTTDKEWEDSSPQTPAPP